MSLCSVVFLCVQDNSASMASFKRNERSFESTSMPSYRLKREDTKHVSLHNPFRQRKAVRTQRSWISPSLFELLVAFSLRIRNCIASFTVCFNDSLIPAGFMKKEKLTLALKTSLTSSFGNCFYVDKSFSIKTSKYSTAHATCCNMQNVS